MPATTEKEYWVAHCRGPNFWRLRERGFLTLYPDIDDYVFLECTLPHERLLRKQLELGVSFLKAREGYVKITGADIAQMIKRTITEKLAVGASILVTEGYGSNLEGTITEIDDEGRRVRCDLVGFNRHYDVWIDRHELVEQNSQHERPTVEFVME
jgi:hypothetical protein